MRQKYLDEGLGTYEIGKLVNRNPKQVYHWLRGYGIPMRARGWQNKDTDKPYQNREWLANEYLIKGRTSTEISKDFGVTGNNIIFFLNKLDIPRRSVSETRAIKFWGLSGSRNGMYGVRGDAHPNWKGGCTAERQAFYNSEEWKAASHIVYKRDKHKCQKCMAQKNLHIHHIVTFAVRELRADPNNLVLLCSTCHYWTHGSQNTDDVFIERRDANVA